MTFGHVQATRQPFSIQLDLLERAGVDATLLLTFDEALASIEAEEFVRRILVDALEARTVLVGRDFRFGARGAGDPALLERMGAEHGFRVDVVGDVRAVHADRRIARVRIDTGEHDLLLEPNVGGDALVGYRDRRPIEIAYGPEVHLDYFTPTTNAITTHRLSGTDEIDVVYLEPVTLEPTPTRQRYELLRRELVRTRSGTFLATRWRYTALATGWTSDLWVADDVVVRYDRAFELISYEPGASGPFPTPP